MYFCLEIYFTFLFNSRSPVFSRFCYYYNYYYYYARCVLEIGPTREVFLIILLLRPLYPLLRCLPIPLFFLLYYYKKTKIKRFGKPWVDYGGGVGPRVVTVGRAQGNKRTNEIKKTAAA